MKRSEGKNFGLIWQWATYERSKISFGGVFRIICQGLVQLFNLTLPY